MDTAPATKKAAPDKLALAVCALVEALAGAGVFNRLGLDADAVAHILGALLALAAAVRWRMVAKGGAAAAALFLLATLPACAHDPTIGGAYKAAESTVDTMKVATSQPATDLLRARYCDVGQCPDADKWDKATAKLRHTVGDFDALLDVLRDDVAAVEALLEEARAK